jgi:multiple sugar transport system ATP-binding protein
VNAFVARFIGSPAMNLVTVGLGPAGEATLGGQALSLPENVRAALDGSGSVSVGVRPESMELAADGIPASVEVVEELGADAFVFATAEVEGQPVKLVARVEARRRPVHGESVRMRPRLDDAHVFHPVTGLRLDA